MEASFQMEADTDNEEQVVTKDMNDARHE